MFPSILAAPSHIKQCGSRAGFSARSVGAHQYAYRCRGMSTWTTATIAVFDAITCQGSSSLPYQAPARLPPRNRQCLTAEAYISRGKSGILQSED